MIGGLRRDAFRLPEGIAYFVGNSLGALPRVSRDAARDVVERQWGELLVSGWDDGWMQLERQVSAQIAGLLGALPSEVAVGDSTSVNLYKLLVGALDLQPPSRRTIVVEGTSFPTDGYIAQGVAASHGAKVVWCDSADPLASVDESTAVVVLGQVDFRTGVRYDVDAVTAAIADRGALVLWDLCHSAGAMPIDLTACGADLAVGCTYKFLNAGPGAPAYAYVATRHQDRFRQPLTGWWGHQEPFAMEQQYRPAAGMAQFAVGTPSIVSLSVLQASLSVFDGVSTAELRTASLALGDALIDGFTTVSGAELELLTPREHPTRGSQVSFRHPDAAPLCRALREHGVWADVRAGSILRLGIAPLYVNSDDVDQAVAALARVWLAR